MKPGTSVAGSFDRKYRLVVQRWGNAGTLLGQLRAITENFITVSALLKSNLCLKLFMGTWKVSHGRESISRRSWKESIP